MLQAQPQAPLLAATNANDAVHRALALGDYSRSPAPTAVTLAPSMDISISSNFERALYHGALACSSGEGTTAAAAAAAACARVRALQAGLRASASASSASSNPLGEDLRQALAAHYPRATASDAQIDGAIASVLRSASYALCPHTAAGWHAAEGAGAGSGTVLLATAHPAKFATGTPALRAHGSGRAYAREVEGVEGVEGGEGGGGSGAGAAAAAAAAAAPALPGHLRGLHLKPLRCLTLRMGAGEGSGAALCEAVKGLCDTVAGLAP